MRTKRGYNGYTTSEIVARAGMAVAALGGIAFAATTINSEPTTQSYNFVVECANTDDKPAIMLVGQEDTYNYTRDYDSVTVGCGANGNIPTSIELSDDEVTDIVLVAKYHEGILDDGAPTVSVEGGGVISFTGNSTFVSWEVVENDSTKEES